VLCTLNFGADFFSKTNMRFVLFLLPLAVIFLANVVDTTLPPKLKLSEYGFFEGKMADLKPNGRVFPYEVNAPLFSDYAEKARFVYLPEGTTMVYDSSMAFQFPVGATIIKNFYYHHNAAQPEQGRRILETRLLVREERGWKALEYIWNDEQTEANLDVAGATLPVTWVDKAQKKHTIDYVAPNQNQCKGCHSYDGKFTPLGTTARQLNRTTPDGQNQLVHWAKQGLLNLPTGFDANKAPHLVRYNDSGLAPETAARAYLDGNCAHCHNSHGPASTSGMFLGADEQDPARLGIGKPPVAAGRGSGNRKFGIVPGKPDQSILLYRMESDDPGIRMPEVGRQLAHEEGIAIVRRWIETMD
jgi:uncharacterized repeat protein (TIGR03806 family)